MRVACEAVRPEPVLHPPPDLTDSSPPASSVPGPQLLGEKCLFYPEGYSISVPHLLIVDLQIGGAEGDRGTQVLHPVQQPGEGPLHDAG